jgi:hypothetical protein
MGEDQTSDLRELLFHSQMGSGVIFGSGIGIGSKQSLGVDFLFESYFRNMRFIVNILLHCKIISHE